jgi:hypothetical protein
LHTPLAQLCWQKSGRPALWCTYISTRLLSRCCLAQPHQRDATTPDLYRLDLASRRVSLFMIGIGGIQNWLPDWDFNFRVRVQLAAAGFEARTCTRSLRTSD